MQTEIHVIASLAVISRLADLLTTYLVSPRLKLEANSLARRFGWWYAWLTVPIGLIAYVSPGAGIVVMTASFMVAASNAAKILMARALGEDGMVALSHRILLEIPPWPALLFMVLPGVFVAALAGSLLYFYPSPHQWAYYFGVGMLTYVFAMFVWYPLQYFRQRAKLR
ncbi:MAG: hypothetical protein P8Z75_00715 [Gammaproteobacteria bacterium]|jgi:hypothetical protein